MMVVSVFVVSGMFFEEVLMEEMVVMEGVWL